ncbi:MAG: UbiD family decarboxylase [Candidatus Bathyarchaeota archaeon]|nr:UbiD family decarboxylase [Candidatus Bathyarchaeota archaeon]
MPFEGLREFLLHLEAEDELARINREVEAVSSFEVSAILDRLQKKREKAVVFQNLKGFDIPMCAGVLGSFRRIALALETVERHLFSEWSHRKQGKWLNTKEVSDGQCSEVVIKGDDVDLFRLPVLKWNPLDGAPYITLGAVISKNPETGKRNAGVYRLMLQGKRQLGVNIMTGRHIAAHYAKAEAKGKPLEVAVAVGLDPAVVLAAATDLELDEDELEFAGALRGEPLRVTRCKTVNVEVPASAEFVIEGMIPPNIRAMEGPFGESNGYYGKPHLQPVLQVTAVTHREKPIYQATYSGKKPQEEHYIGAFNSAPQNVPEEEFVSQKRSVAALACGFYGRLKNGLTLSPVKLPLEDTEKAVRNWAEYGLEQSPASTKQHLGEVTCESSALPNTDQHM